MAEESTGKETGRKRPREVFEVSVDRPHTVLRVQMSGSPTAEEVAEFLADISNAYSEIDGFFLESPMSDEERHRQFTSLTGHRAAGTKLILGSVTMRSPGPWEFIGNLNPLKVIADFIQQRHERKKDNKYRNKAEKERLALENAILKNQVLRERIELCEKLGLSPQEVQLEFRKAIAKPLNRLGPHVDTGLITDAVVGERNDPAA